MSNKKRRNKSFPGLLSGISPLREALFFPRFIPSGFLEVANNLAGNICASYFLYFLVYHAKIAPASIRVLLAKKYYASIGCYWPRNIMPVIKSAIKKLRQDKKREKQNDTIRATVKSAIKKAQKDTKGESVRAAISLIDKAAKKNIFHKNKAARMKSSLTKIAKPTARRHAPHKMELASPLGGKIATKKTPVAKKTTPKKKAK